MLKFEIYQQSMYQTQNNQKIEIPQIRELQAQIRRNQPVNMMKFIRRWAKQHSKQKLSSSDDDQGGEIFKAGNYKRRKAIFQISLVKEKKQQKITEKSEESRSLIYISLRKNDILRDLQEKHIIQLTQQAEIVEKKSADTIIEKGSIIDTLYIILRGSVRRKKNQRQIILQTGQSFGCESILFNIDNKETFICEQSVQLALIQSQIIRQIVRQSNKERYKFFISSLKFISIFGMLDNEELDKLASLAMNTPSILTIPQQEIIKEGNIQAFYIVVEGEFAMYGRKLVGALKKTATKKFFPQDSFGLQCLEDSREIDFTIVSEEEGRVVRIAKVDTERILGDLWKIRKRKKAIR